MILRNADVDNDGSITLDDFRALVAGQCKNPNELTFYTGGDNA